MTTEQTAIIRKLAIAVLLVAFGASVGYWWAHRTAKGSQSRSSAADSTEHDAAARKRRILYWHDPMVPARRFDKPGKSPFMDMPLVPVYEDEVDGGGQVRVSPAMAQNLGIRLGRVERSTLGSQLRAVGNVAFDERLREAMQARVDGYVTRLYVKAPLERVRRGQALADILAPQWLEAQEEYLALLESKAASVQGLRDAARQRLTVLGVPETTIRSVETTRRTQATTTVFAPIDGVLTELGVRQGAAFMAGASLFQLNGLGTVWINAQVPEAQVSRVPVGSKVVAHATGWSGVAFKGQVIALVPEIEPQTRTLTARVSIDNEEGKLSPGMFLMLDIAAPAGEPQLVVPSEAIIATSERNVVIALNEAGGFDVVDVTPGVEQDGKTAILSGLEEGQSIVLSGQFLIDSEASLSSTINRLESTETQAAPQHVDVSADGGNVGAEGSAALATHSTRGTVTAISPQEVTISHEAVPSLDRPAMTMSFKLPAQGVPADLKIGDRVRFSFTESDGRFQISSIARVRSSAQPEKSQ
jgi:Cu(I)/Ag(I) efflux system membrane fusion protein